jgi:hypothetical protein
MRSERSSDITYDQCKPLCDAFGDLFDTMKVQKVSVSADTLCNMDKTLLCITRDGHLEVELIPHEEQTGTQVCDTCATFCKCKHVLSFENENKRI